MEVAEGRLPIADFGLILRGEIGWAALRRSRDFGILLTRIQDLGEVL